MNLLALLPKALKTLAKVSGLKIFEEASNVVGGIAVTPELQAAMAAHEKDMALIDTDALKTLISESIAEIQSPDKFVSRARPALLYIAGVLTSFMIIVIAILMLKHIPVDWAAVASLTSLTTPLWGYAGWYSKLRTDEKLGSNNGH